MFRKARELPPEALCGRLSLSPELPGPIPLRARDRRGEEAPTVTLMKESASLCPLGVLVPG